MNVTAIISALADPDPDAEVRREAARALEQIGHDAKDAVPALSKSLDDPDADVRYWSTAAIASVGPAAVSAIPALSKALADTDVDAL